MSSNLLITGKIRCGKSSLLKEQLIPIGEGTGGFFIQRLFVQGESCGFRMADISVEEFIPNIEVDRIDAFSDLIAEQDPKRFYLETFELKGVGLLEQAMSNSRLVVMDEIGTIEANALVFRETVFHMLNSDIPVLGVLKKASHPFLDSIRNRYDVRVLDLDTHPYSWVRNEINCFIKRVLTDIYRRQVC